MILQKGGQVTNSKKFYARQNVVPYQRNVVPYLWYPSAFPGGKSVSVLSKDLLNLEPPLDNPEFG